MSTKDAGVQAGSDATGTQKPPWENGSKAGGPKVSKKKAGKRGRRAKGKRKAGKKTPPPAEKKAVDYVIVHCPHCRSTATRRVGPAKKDSGGREYFYRFCDECRQRFKEPLGLAETKGK